VLREAREEGKTIWRKVIGPGREELAYALLVAQEAKLFLRQYLARDPVDPDNLRDLASDLITLEAALPGGVDPEDDDMGRPFFLRYNDMLENWPEGRCDIIEIERADDDQEKQKIAGPTSEELAYALMAAENAGIFLKQYQSQERVDPDNLMELARYLVELEMNLAGGDHLGDYLGRINQLLEHWPKDLAPDEVEIEDMVA
jgi:hypothetical protein